MKKKCLLKMIGEEEEKLNYKLHSLDSDILEQVIRSLAVSMPL